MRYEIRIHLPSEEKIGNRLIFSTDSWEDAYAAFEDVTHWPYPRETLVELRVCDDGGSMTEISETIA